MYLKKERFYLSECLYKSSIFIQYRYFKKRIIEKKQITITYCRVMCKYGVWRKKTGLWGR